MWNPNAPWNKTHKGVNLTRDYVDLLEKAAKKKGIKRGEVLEELVKKHINEVVVWS